MFFHLKLLYPSVAAGWVSSVATDLVPLLLVPQCSSKSLVSDGNEDDEKKVLAGSVDKVTPVSTNRPSKESRETEEILSILKVSNDQTKKILEQIDSTLAASTPDLK